TRDGRVTTFAGGYPARGSDDGSGPAARFNRPSGVAADSLGNVYVADTGNNTIRKTSADGVVTTLAGTPGVAGATDGKGTDAQFTSTEGVAVDSDGTVYVADTGNRTIRRIAPDGTVSTLTGTGAQAQFSNPTALAVGATGDLYVT